MPPAAKSQTAEELCIQSCDHCNEQAAGEIQFDSEVMPDAEANSHQQPIQEPLASTGDDGKGTGHDGKGKGTVDDANGGALYRYQ